MTTPATPNFGLELLAEVLPQLTLSALLVANAIAFATGPTARGTLRAMVGNASRATGVPPHVLRRAVRAIIRGRALRPAPDPRLLALAHPIARSVVDVEGRQIRRVRTIAPGAIAGVAVLLAGALAAAIGTGGPEGIPAVEAGDVVLIALICAAYQAFWLYGMPALHRRQVDRLAAPEGAPAAG